MLPPAVTITTEIYADAEGLAFFVTVPQDRDVGLRALISAHIPGLILVSATGPEDQVVTTTWDQVFEIGMSRAHRPLRLDKPEPAVAGLLSAFGGLRRGEAVALQWVITGARQSGKLSTDQPGQSWRRRDVEAHNAKHAEPTFLAVGRLAARTPTGCWPGSAACLRACVLTVWRWSGSAPAPTWRPNGSGNGPAC